MNSENAVWIVQKTGEKSAQINDWEKKTMNSTNWTNQKYKNIYAYSYKYLKGKEKVQTEDWRKKQCYSYCNYHATWTNQKYFNFYTFT